MIGLAGLVGVEASLRFGAAFGRAWFVLGLPRTRRVREQLDAAFPDRTAAEREGWAGEVFEHLGQGLSELILLSGRHRAFMLDRVEVEGLEHLERAQAEAGGMGALVIGPHLGNWELAAAKLAELGVPVSAVYRGARQPALERAILRVRAGTAPVLSEKGDPIQQIAMGRRAGVQFVRALKSGRSVLVLLDQHAGAGEGLRVPFFGRPANTRFGPLKLADRVGSPVLLAFARRRTDRRRHVLTIYPALQLAPGASDDERVLRQNLEQVTAELEAEIRTSPGQWIWTHRRWREPARSDAAD
jgi:KDO2-lipid IV(A) lauroyltransferase